MNETKEYVIKAVQANKEAIEKLQQMYDGKNMDGNKVTKTPTEPTTNATTGGTATTTPTLPTTTTTEPRTPLLFATKIHVEEGSVSCGSSTNWGIYGLKYVTSKFPRRYIRPPIVFIAVNRWKAKTDKPFVKYEAFVSKVNRSHVTVGCYIEGNAGEIVEMNVNWISFSSGV